MSTRKPYPSDVCDDEWSLVAPYLTLLSEDACRRKYQLREVITMGCATSCAQELIGA
jgi:hypothetical protein